MARNINFFDGAQSGTVPTIGNIVASSLVQYANDAAYELAEVGAPVTGNIYYNTTDNVIRYYNATAWISIVDESTAQTLTNKSIDGNNNPITNVDGDEVIIDAIPDLTATNAQAAFAEHETEINARILLTEKGANNGVATLDGGGKVPSTQLPDTLMEYQGTWDGSTNTPTLADGVGNAGDVYDCQVAGTVDFGAGNITFVIGDWVVYNGTIWEKSTNSDAVTSVNSQQGIVVLDSDDIAEGSTNEYYTEAKVTANTSVAANTAKVSASGSIDTHSDMDTSTIPPVLDEVLKWDGSNWVPGVGGGSGSGQGGINYIKNTDFETNSDDVTVTANITKALETSDPIRGTQSLKLTIDTAATGADYADLDMNDVDPIDVESSKILNISFDYYTDANFSTDDVQFVLRRVDATAADILLIDELNGKVLKSTNKIQFNSRVQIDDDANTYTLRMNVLSAPASDSIIVIENVKVGPAPLVPTQISHGWTEYTPTLTTSGGGSITLNATSKVDVWGFYKRQGDTIIINYGFRNGTGGGATGTAGNMIVSLPPNVTRLDDGSSKSDVTFGNYLGSAHISSASVAGGSYDVHGNSISVGDASGVITVADIVASYAISGRAEFKVTEWSEGANLSTSEVAITTIKVSGAGNAATSLTADVTNIDFIETEDPFGAWDGSQFTAPKTGYYDILGGVIANASVTCQYAVFVDGTIRINIGSSISDSVASLVGSVKLNKGEVLTIRARTSITLSNNSTYHWITIQGKPDFSVFSVYGTSELVQSDSGGLVSYTVTPDTWGNVASISLGVGEWDIVADMTMYANGATTALNMLMGISTLPTTDPGTYGPDKGFAKFPNTSQHAAYIGFTKSGFIMSTPGTVYLNTYLLTSNTNCEVSYKITARRIK